MPAFMSKASKPSAPGSRSAPGVVLAGPFSIGFPRLAVKYAHALSIVSSYFGTATLVSESSYVTVIDDSGSFGTILPDGTGENTSDRFTVSVDASTYGGYLASFQLLTSFSGGLPDTTEFTLTVGTRSSNDPIGPDRRGYLAYDDTDTAYPEAPTYSWLEIDPEYAWTWAELGLLLHGNLSGFDQAEQAYRKAIEIDPEYAPTWLALGVLLHEQLSRFDEAEQAYRRKSS